MKSTNKPNPGSEAAIKLGCKCPDMDNEYGKGWCGQGRKGVFVISGLCQLHNKEFDESNNKKTKMITKKRKSYFGALKGIGSFTKEDEMRAHEMLTPVKCSWCNKKCFGYVSVEFHSGSNYDLNRYSGHICDACFERHLKKYLERRSDPQWED